MKGSGSIFSSDEAPAEFGPVDPNYWYLQPVTQDKDHIILDITDDISRLTAGYSPAKEPVKRGLFRRKGATPASNN